MQPFLQPMLDAVARLDLRAYARADVFDPLLVAGGRLGDLRFPADLFAEVMQDFLPRLAERNLLVYADASMYYGPICVERRPGIVQDWLDIVLRELERGGPQEEQDKLLLLLSILAAGDIPEEKHMLLVLMMSLFPIQAKEYLAHRGKAARA